MAKSLKHNMLLLSSRKSIMIIYTNVGKFFKVQTASITFEVYMNPKRILLVRIIIKQFLAVYDNILKKQSGTNELIQWCRLYVKLEFQTL